VDHRENKENAWKRALRHAAQAFPAAARAAPNYATRHKKEVDWRWWQKTSLGFGRFPTSGRRNLNSKKNLGSEKRKPTLCAAKKTEMPDTRHLPWAFLGERLGRAGPAESSTSELWSHLGISPAVLAELLRRTILWCGLEEISG
jgi:hypothetical protein